MSGSPDVKFDDDFPAFNFQGDTASRIIPSMAPIPASSIYEYAIVD